MHKDYMHDIETLSGFKMSHTGIYNRKLLKEYSDYKCDHVNGFIHTCIHVSHIFVLILTLLSTNCTCIVSTYYSGVEQLNRLHVLAPVL